MGGEQLRNGEENVRFKDKADVFFSLLAALTETTLLRITRLPDKPLIMTIESNQDSKEEDHDTHL